MTTDERVATLTALWRAARALVPVRSRSAFDELQVAIEANYNDHGDARAMDGYRQGRQDGEAALEGAQAESYRAGMIAVKKRSDFRDLDEIGDPEELRSTH